MVENTSGRRKFLNKIGAVAVAGSGIAGVARADRSGLNTRSAEDAGISDEIEALLDERKYEEAHQLLERHDVTHGFGRDTHVETEDGDGLSSSDFAVKSQSDFYTTAWVSGSETFDGEERDIITVECNWYPEFSKDIDAPAPIDAASIYWEANVFGLVTGSVSYSSRLDFGATVDNQYEYGVIDEESPNLDNGTEGLTVSYDDTVTRSAPPGNNPAVLYAQEGRGSLRLKLRRQIESFGNLRTEFGHNWSVGGNSWDPSNVSLNIGSYVSYNLPALSDNWILADQQDI
jgi:hypothetical protein